MGWVDAWKGGELKGAATACGCRCDFDIAQRGGFGDFNVSGHRTTTSVSGGIHLNLGGRVGAG